MRIGLVVQGGFDRSGTERVTPALLWLAERLARRHDVHVFVLRYHAEACDYPLLGAAVHDLGGRGPAGANAFRLGRALLAALRRTGPFDVLHAYGGAPPGALAVTAGTLLGVPSVVTLQGGELADLPDIAYGLQRGWRSRAAVGWAIRMAARVSVDTRYMRSLLGSRGGNRVREIAMGVDASFFEPVRHREAGPPWRLLHVANLNAVKDQGTLLHAFAAVRRALPEVTLDVVGEDTLGGRVQARARELDVHDAVTFHGFLPSAAVRDLCGRAHLMVQSSRHEGAAVAVLEAAARGVPTVGTAVGHVADLAPEHAVAVPAGDAKALADGIVQLLRDPARREALGQAARVFVRRFDADRTAEAFEALYAEIRRR